MATSKPVFVMVTAATCGACQNLHKRWSPIRKAIQSLGTVRLVEIQLPDMGAQVVAQGYPADLQRYIFWFPTAFLFTGENWDDVVAGRGKTLDGVILNGIVGNPRPQSGKYSLTSEGLTSWVHDTLQNPKFSSRSKSPSTPSDPRSRLFARVQKERYIPTSGSAEICRKMKLKAKTIF